MRSVKVFSNNEFIEIPLQEYLNKYHSEITDDWIRFMGYVNQAFEITTTTDYNSFLKAMNFKSFDYEKMKRVYQDIKLNDQLPSLDDDILKFISYLYGEGYFERIGDPNLIHWLDMKDINRPFDNADHEDSYSIREVSSMNNGLNAIKYKLLFALNW